ncbi:hypothetical protein ABG79_01780 [Caloramator mitchellensis]|uniref:Putative restriction endonuclease domain-containing protein n=1 Tax=Caloramator mitchellensis TaxID=908809 RepID=A0A0R3K270_CALMK|nr:Uma2 family endonuclease [Caloramator mitchellensis]KRQ86399.1 hypothetical protein ABG79_01780 [Caloramator mitchellensis]
MGIPNKANINKFTYNDYLNWPENERWEIIDGEAYNMSPAPSRLHQDILGALFSVFYNYLKNKQCKVYPAPFDVRLNLEGEEDSNCKNVVQPDISIICDISKLDERGCKGSPDLIIEIISPATIKRDLKDKFYLYEKAQVKEYWIVYPEEKTIIIYKLENGRYGRPEIYSEEDKIKVGIFQELNICLGEIFS